MPRQVGFFTKWSQYLGMRAVSFLVSLGDVNSVLRVLGGIGRVGYLVDGKHRRRVMTNLTRAMPDLSNAARERVTRGAFEHLLKLLGELAVTPNLLRADNWTKYVRLGNMGRSLEYLDTGKPVLVVTGHIGNWELLGFTMALLGFPVHALARPLDNPKVDHWVRAAREDRGLQIVSKFEAAKRMPVILDDRGILGFVADQDAGRKGMFVPFFNRLASAPRSISLLAMKWNTPVICGMCRRMGDGFRHEISVADLILPKDWEGQPDPMYYLTARYTRAIETMVRQCPDQYLWMHRRWKSRPVWEEKGKPMPAAFEQKLQSLPWMTPDLLEQVKIPVMA